MTQRAVVSVNVHLRDGNEVVGYVRKENEETERPWVSITVGGQQVTWFVQDAIQRRQLGDMLIELGKALLTNREREYEWSA